MKKLLIFMLVFGLASMANATISLVSPDNSTLQIAGSSETEPPSVGKSFWLSITGTGSIDAGTMNYTGNQAGISTETDTDILDILEDAITAYVGTHTEYTGGSIVDCDWVEFTGTDVPLPSMNITLAEWGVTTSYVEAYMHDSETGDVVDAIYIPEPITIALLGLGGLFLRRRK